MWAGWEGNEPSLAFQSVNPWTSTECGLEIFAFIWSFFPLLYSLTRWKRQWRQHTHFHGQPRAHGNAAEHRKLQNIVGVEDLQLVDQEAKPHLVRALSATKVQ